MSSCRTSYSLAICLGREKRPSSRHTFGFCWAKDVAHYASHYNTTTSEGRCQAARCYISPSESRSHQLLSWLWSLFFKRVAVMSSSHVVSGTSGAEGPGIDEQERLFWPEMGEGPAISGQSCPKEPGDRVFTSNDVPRVLRCLGPSMTDLKKLFSYLDVYLEYSCRTQDEKVNLTSPPLRLDSATLKCILNGRCLCHLRISAFASPGSEPSVSGRLRATSNIFR